MATGIKERLEGRMPRQQVTECAKQYVLNWHVLQKYGIPLENIPAEYTVMYIPFSERYRYPILIVFHLGRSLRADGDSLALFQPTARTQAQA